MRHISVLLLLAVLAGCSPGERTERVVEQEAPPRSIEDIADAYFAAYLLRFPTRPTAWGIPGHRHDRLTDLSSEAIDRWATYQAEVLEELEALGWPADVGGRDWVTYGVLHHELSSGLATRVCRSELWSASTTTAWYRSVPFVFDSQPLATEQDREDALARLSSLDDYLATHISNLRLGLELGYSAPRVTVEAVPGQASALLADDNPFLAMGERAGAPEFAEAVAGVFELEVRPAIDDYVAFIRDEYLPAARESLPVTDHPDGAECYEALIQSYSTVNKPADEVHDLGIRQMARIQQEFREVINASFDGESTPALLRRINSDPEFTFGSEAAILDYNIKALAEARKAMPRAFGRLPVADVVIEPYPSFAESGVGEYKLPAEDGSRPGRFLVAVVQPETRTRATQKSTLYHETYPGHHLHLAIAQELGDAVHPIARYFTNSGFAEGWALYSERVAEELGLYTNPVDQLGLLSDQGARAARMVVDTGVHTRGWTRQRVVDYMLVNTGWSETDIQNDTDRYISWPGQANAYMLGMLEIVRLREKAESALGERFDIRAFHDRVLGFGTITLPMLSRSVDTWIEAGLLEAAAEPDDD